MIAPTPIADMTGPAMPSSPESVASAGMPMVMNPADRPMSAPSTARNRIAGERRSPTSPCSRASGTHARECELKASSSPPMSMLTPTVAMPSFGEMFSATRVAMTGPSSMTRLWYAVSTL